jgi:Protein of unknown function (DUF3102)
MSSTANPPTTSNYLADLAARIKAEHEAATGFIKQGLERAIHAGKLLIEAKDHLPHGQWLPWLREHCPALPERTASHYMRLAHHEDDLRAKSANLADLNISEAVGLLTPVAPLGALGLHAQLAAIDPRIVLTPTGLKLPDDLSFENWKIIGAMLFAFFPTVNEGGRS